MSVNNEHEHHINGKWCCVVFWSKENEADSIVQMIKEAVPQCVSVASISKNEVQLTLDEEHSCIEDSIELCRALSDNIENDLSVSVYVGIGRTYNNTDQAGASLKDAKEAASFARQMGKLPGVYTYTQIALENFLKNIPPDLGERFCSSIGSKEMDKLLGADYAEVINAIFENNLNLSQTARNSYMHRNTILYKIEKLYRDTGLDIRRFEHAVLIKLLIMLKEKQRL